VGGGKKKKKKKKKKWVQVAASEVFKFSVFGVERLGLASISDFENGDRGVDRC
jgi:hypothetical protein